MKLAEIVVDKIVRMYTPSDNISITNAIRLLLGSEWNTIHIEYQDVELNYKYK